MTSLTWKHFLATLTHLSTVHFLAPQCIEIRTTSNNVCKFNNTQFWPFECTVKLLTQQPMVATHHTRHSDFDATQNADALASLYIDSDDAASYALAG